MNVVTEGIFAGSPLPEVYPANPSDCERCKTDAYVPHNNCRCGANRHHCTSDYCY